MYITEHKPSSIDQNVSAERIASLRRTSTLQSLSPTLSQAVYSSILMLNETPPPPPPARICCPRQQPSFNMADMPKQLTTTLTKPISTFQSQTNNNNKKFIHPSS